MPAEEVPVTQCFTPFEPLERTKHPQNCNRGINQPPGMNDTILKGDTGNKIRAYSTLPKGLISLSYYLQDTGDVKQVSFVLIEWSGLCPV